uniref:Uma2 family endonuclease n=1 Tax=Clostridium butyricum TaxID=1492 RepID=UPI001558A2B3|nr:Uma2 family endonuclease [Clostridium butyricum]
MSTAVDYKHYREEIIDGKVYYMPPSANPIHGRIIGNVYYVFKSYLKGKTCQVFTDTIDVYLDDKKEDRVIPDVSVLCNKDCFTNRGYEGVPSLVVEVLSPTSVSRDRKIKFNLYEKYGVKEYWIIDPVNKVLEQYVLIDGKYSLEGTFVKLEEYDKERINENEISEFKSSFKTSIFDELVVNIDDIFE